MPECTKTTPFEKNIKPQIFLALGPPTTPPSLYFWIRPCCVYIICYTLHCFYFPITHFIRLPPRLPWCLTLYAFGIEPRCRHEVPPPNFWTVVAPLMVWNYCYDKSDVERYEKDISLCW